MYHSDLKVGNESNDFLSSLKKQALVNYKHIFCEKIVRRNLCADNLLCPKVVGNDYCKSKDIY